MAFQANVYYVMIASPSDVCEERERIVNLLMDWNREHTESLGVVLLPYKQLKGKHQKDELYLADLLK